jgi:predicted  nucleic acid-binding Zn-ribbon protein
MSNDEFGSTGDPGTSKESFDAKPADQADGNKEVITPEELNALQKRDENAQTHIPQLEGENEQLRTKVAELETNLASATALDDVLKHLDKDKEGGNTEVIDPDELAAKVEDRLQRKAQEKVYQDNWDGVVTNLTESFGKFEDADVAIQAKCAELGMAVSEATELARKSPKAFYKIFEMEQASPQTTVASQATQQTSIVDLGVGTKHDKAYYDEMRKKNPREWNKTSTQAQLRRDVYGAGT